jgi:hypothetical protein
MIAHPIFRRRITTLESAKVLLRYLVEKDLSYHPEDSAHDVSHPFTEEEADALDQRMTEIYSLHWPQPYGCPSGYILSRSPQFISTGRVIQALLHTLLQSYGNENVYHPDGTAIRVDDLVEEFLRIDPPAGEALEAEQEESTLDNVANEINGRVNDDSVSEAYYAYQHELHAAIKAKFPTTKFGSF